MQLPSHELSQPSHELSQLEYTKSVTWQNVGAGVGTGDGAGVGAGDGAFVLFVTVQHPQPSTPQPSA